MANNGGTSTLKLFMLGSNHCADDPMKGLDPPNPIKHKAERGGGGEGERPEEEGQPKEGSKTRAWNANSGE